MGFRATPDTIRPPPCGPPGSVGPGLRPVPVVTGVGGAAGGFFPPPPCPPGPPPLPSASAGRPRPRGGRRGSVGAGCGPVPVVAGVGGAAGDFPPPRHGRPAPRLLPWESAGRPARRGRTHGTDRGECAGGRAGGGPGGDRVGAVH